MKPGKLAPGSLLTTDDQVALYRELMGVEKAAHQVYLARLEAGKCVCTPRKVKRKWMDSEKATTRKVHEPLCPKWKRWMVL